MALTNLLKDQCLPSKLKHNIIYWIYFLYRSPLTVSRSCPLSPPVSYLPPLPPAHLITTIESEQPTPSSPLPSNSLIRAHLPEGQRTIVSKKLLT